MYFGWVEFGVILEPLLSVAPIEVKDLRDEGIETRERVTLP